MTPSGIIRELAALSAVPEVRARLEVLAAEFETQHNNQNGQWAIIFGRLENALADDLKAVRFDLDQEMGHSEARENKILEMLEQIQEDVRELKAREVGDASD